MKYLKLYKNKRSVNFEKKRSLFGIIILMFTFTSCSSEYNSSRATDMLTTYEHLIKENDSLRKENKRLQTENNLLKTDINYGTKK